MGLVRRSRTYLLGRHSQVGARLHDVLHDDGAHPDHGVVANANVLPKRSLRAHINPIPELTVAADVGARGYGAEITKGTRLVAVTWAQSMIRDADKRELLYNLHTTRESLQKKYPDDDEVVKIDHTYINLVRMWTEI